MFADNRFDVRMVKFSLWQLSFLLTHRMRTCWTNEINIGKWFMCLHHLHQCQFQLEFWKGFSQIYFILCLIQLCPMKFRLCWKFQNHSCSSYRAHQPPPSPPPPPQHQQNTRTHRWPSQRLVPSKSHYLRKAFNLLLFIDIINVVECTKSRWSN